MWKVESGRWKVKELFGVRQNDDELGRRPL